MIDKQETAEVVETIKTSHTAKQWGTVADQLDDTMRQRLIDFGKKIL
jgi:hypothetical protein